MGSDNLGVKCIRFDEGIVEGGVKSGKKRLEAG
jgi:hypothetical protein